MLMNGQFPCGAMKFGFGAITSCFRDLLLRPLVFSSPPWFALDQSDNSFNLERE